MPSYKKAQTITQIVLKGTSPEVLGWSGDLRRVSKKDVDMFASILESNVTSTPVLQKVLSENNPLDEPEDFKFLFHMERSVSLDALAWRLGSKHHCFRALSIVSTHLERLALKRREEKDVRHLNREWMSDFYIKDARTEVYSGASWFDAVVLESTFKKHRHLHYVRLTVEAPRPFEATFLQKNNSVKLESEYRHLAFPSKATWVLYVAEVRLYLSNSGLQDDLIWLALQWLWPHILPCLQHTQWAKNTRYARPVDKDAKVLKRIERREKAHKERAIHLDEITRLSNALAAKTAAQVEAVLPAAKITAPSPDSNLQRLRKRAPRESAKKKRSKRHKFI